MLFPTEVSIIFFWCVLALLSCAFLSSNMVFLDVAGVPLLLGVYLCVILVGSVMLISLYIVKVFL